MGEVLKDFMLIFKFACKWAMSEKLTLGLIEFLIIKSEYIYLAHICVLRDYVSFGYKTI